ncbi:MAG: DegT/DnrJ/EryC1/StrS family aminotransferase [Verrucomicrobia bacterium]|nr:DegT/DnrJ/EryC1/StrS family aminotransferase [Verrucomicrobiota bacterium]
MDKKLAINGGEKAAPVLPNRFHFGKEEKDAINKLFDDAIATGNAPGYNGPEEEAFCKEFAEFMGAKYADGTNGGTNSVYVALKSLNLPPFSEVIVGCVTDPGGMMPIAINNCIPVPADTAPGTFNTGAKEIEARITERTSAILVAHIGGEPADMPAIMAVAAKHNLPVVEDCAQSHMAKINGKNVGTFGRYGAFSLMFGKHMCTGGQGGAVICNTEEDYWNERRAADRGKPFNLPAGSTNNIPAISCNMDEFHAAVGRVQLKKLSGIVARRKKAVEMLKAAGLKDLKSISIPEMKKGVDHCYWWVGLKFNADVMKCTKEEFCAALTAEGLLVVPNYTGALPAKMDWYKNRASQHPWNNPLYKGEAGKKDYPTPNCDQAIKDTFILFVYESFGEKEVAMVVKAFQKVEAHYAK